jgi:uncharacterized protein (TIGR02996 family)
MLRAMSSSREALFQAVLDRPADDAPRALFAALLDAQGDPYGAFIRAQLARTRALRSGTDEEAWRLYDEARRIEAEHRTAAWTNGVEKLVKHVQFIRGFVDRVIIDARRYVDHADELYRRAPIRHLVLTEVGDLMTAIARDPHLLQITWLTIEGKPPIGDAGLAAIAASPHLRGLQVLGAVGQGIGMAGLEALCASKAVPSLVYVNLVGNRFEDPIEGYGTDWATGRIDLNGAYLPPFGRELEAKYGELPWLHAPSRLRHFPPPADEL